MLPRVLSFALMVLLFGSVLGAQEPRPAPAGFCLDCGLLEGRPERCQGCEAPVVVDADVLMFYWIMSALGRGRPTRSFEERGLGNPLLGLERVDGSLDIERLASLWLAR